MDWTVIIGAGIVGALIGYRIGRAWERVRVYLRRWHVIGPDRPARLVRHDAVVPAIAATHYDDAWRAHLIAFASACATAQRISERAVVSAGIVSCERDYRVMARYMARVGLWAEQGPRRPRRWTDRHPTRAVGRVAESIRSGRLHLPYPSHRPPPVYPLR